MADISQESITETILAHVSTTTSDTSAFGAVAAASGDQMTAEAFSAQYGGPIVDAIRRLKETLGNLPMDLALKAAHAALTVLGAKFGLSAELVAIAWSIIEPAIKSLFEG